MMATSKQQARRCKFRKPGGKRWFKQQYNRLMRRESKQKPDCPTSRAYYDYAD